MTFEDIERMAATNSPMTPDMRTTEQLAYLCIRNLYIGFRRGVVNKEEASQEKKLIRKQFEERTSADDYIKNVFKDWQDNIKKSEMVRSEINRSKESTVSELFILAVQCISLMTGDKTFLKNIDKAVDKQLILGSEDIAS